MIGPSLKRFVLLLMIIILTAVAFLPITERTAEGGRSTAAQVGVGKDGGDFLRQLSADLDKVLTFR